MIPTAIPAAVLSKALRAVSIPLKKKKFILSFKLKADTKTQLHHAIRYTITNQVPDPGIPIVWITATTNWKKNTKKNTMKLNELSLLQRKQENKYYLIHRRKKHVQKRGQFYYFRKSNALLPNHWPAQLLAGREYTLLKASTANASSSRYSMWTVKFLQQRGSRLSSEMWHFVVWCEGTSTSEQLPPASR